MPIAVSVKLYLGALPRLGENGNRNTPSIHPRTVKVAIAQCNPLEILGLQGQTVY